MRYHEVTDRVASAAERAGRSRSSVKMVVVSKGRAPREIMAVYEAGHRLFGENRASELAAKASQLPDDIEWHFVGALQSNKARLVRPVITLLHSLDRLTLATAWLKGPGLPPPALVQVNIGREAQKSGVEPEAAAGLVGDASQLGITIRGLMAIPPYSPEPERMRPHFRRLAELASGLDTLVEGKIELSIGMSEDFEVAIEEGSTLIRLGRAIFGEPKTEPMG